MNPISTQTADTDKALKSQTLVRGLEVVEAVAEGPLSIPDIAKRTGITYSTAHRIVSVLVQRNYLKHHAGRGYGLGRKLLELGFLAHQQVSLTRVAHPFLEQLARSTLDTVHLARLEDNDVIYLDKISNQRAVEISSRIGGRKPLISTGIGKALILDEPEAVWAALYERDFGLLHTRPTKSQWLASMRKYAQGGYAYDLGEDSPAIRCVAAPIRDGSRRIIAAISVSSTLEHMESDRMASLVPIVKRVADQISAELGMQT